MTHLPRETRDAFRELLVMHELSLLPEDALRRVLQSIQHTLQRSLSKPLPR